LKKTTHYRICWEVYLKDRKIKEPKKKDMEVNNEKNI